jgi:hypothetical protein
LQLAQGKSIVHGHTHRVDTSMIQSIHSAGKTLEGRGAGCTCRPIPTYGTGNPVEWVNSFIIGYLGRASDTMYTIPVRQDSCIMPDGREISA